MAREAPSLFHTARILVVDDDPGVRESVAELLAAFGMSATTAVSGRAALGLCGRDCPFDIVLADVVMADIGGVQLAEMLRERHPDLPVILMTGRDSLVDGVIDEGVVPLFKPFSSLQLKQIIDDALDH